MSDAEVRLEDGPQIDRGIAGSSPDVAHKVTVPCTGCHASIDTEYYSVNGNAFCGRCRAAVASLAETPQDVATLAKTALLGGGASVVGAALYYAVMAFAHLQIGIVAILIGYIVGRAIRKAAGNRGGLRFQILAVLLTYASIALAYAPFALRAAAERTSVSDYSAGTAPEATPRPAMKSRGAALVLRVSASLAFMAVLPILAVVTSFPSGLISAVIMFVGIRQAWSLTRAPTFNILGPYRVGTVPASPLA
jgi:hypothetical protein